MVTHKKARLLTARPFFKTYLIINTPGSVPNNWAG